MDVGRVAAFGAVCAAAFAAGCGSGGESSGPPTINWYVFNEPGGAYEQAVANCNKQAKGRFKINYVRLPTDANQQRELVVRRLAAKDSSVDLVGMDVIWTAEFANAGWVSQWPADLAKQVTEGVFPSVIQTASFEGNLYGAPFNSNT